MLLFGETYIIFGSSASLARLCHDSLDPDTDFIPPNSLSHLVLCLLCSSSAPMTATHPRQIYPTYTATSVSTFDCLDARPGHSAPAGPLRRLPYTTLLWQPVIYRPTTNGIIVYGSWFRLRLSVHKALLGLACSNGGGNDDGGGPFRAMNPAQTVPRRQKISWDHGVCQRAIRLMVRAYEKLYAQANVY